MRFRRDGLTAAAFLAAALMFWLVSLSADDRELAERLSGEILRFHVVADSDSKRDQELKLDVRSLLLDAIRQGAGPGASKEELLSYLAGHEEELLQTADRYIAEQGFDYTARMEIGESHFPAKVYGDLLFPAGDYEAVRIILGNGKGRNWWCVLYPSLCFVSDTAAVVPDSSKQQLKGMLAEEDYASLSAMHPDIRIAFRLPQWFRPPKWLDRLLGRAEP